MSGHVGHGAVKRCGAEPRTWTDGAGRNLGSGELAQWNDTAGAAGWGADGRAVVMGCDASLARGGGAVETLPDRLRAAQRLFDRTGGVHAAGLFSADGELLCLREDVGRHNAVDKVVGYALRSGLLPLRETILMVSGRASFELVQ